MTEGCTSEAARAMITQEQEGYLGSSHILDYFKHFENIKTLSLELPRTLIEVDKSFAPLVCFKALTNLRVDEVGSMPFFEEFEFRELIRCCKQIKGLRTFDLRFGQECSATNPFFDGWHKEIPQIETLRVNYKSLPGALLSTEPEDDVRFELLMDLIELERGAKSGSIESNLYEDDWYDMNDADLQRVLEAIQSIKRLLLWKRESEFLDKRSVGLMQWTWPEGVCGERWFMSSGCYEQFCDRLQAFLADNKVLDHRVTSSWVNPS